MHDVLQKNRWEHLTYTVKRTAIGCLQGHPMLPRMHSIFTETDHISFLVLQSAEMVYSIMLPLISLTL